MQSPNRAVRHIRALLPALALALLAAPPALAQDCNSNAIPDATDAAASVREFSSNTLAPFDNENPFYFIIEHVPFAQGDVTLAATVTADLNHPNEVVNVFIQGQPVGVLYDEALDPCQPDAFDQLVIPASVFNDLLPGPLLIVLQAPLSNTISCAGSQASITLSIPYDDCNDNAVPDECEDDCNANAIPDDCDIASGFSDDLNNDGVPDECQDCNENSIPDDMDIASGTSQDCNTDGIPDECQLDCNANGLADECDAASGFSDDCNANDLPDECELVLPSGVVQQIPFASPNSLIALDGDLAIATDATAHTVHVLSRSSATWQDVATLTYPGGSGAQSFGNRIALHGTTVLVTDSKLGYPGSLFVFEQDQNDPAVWTNTAALVTPDNSTFESIAFDGDTVLITGRVIVPGQQPGSFSVTGPAAHVFARNQGGPDAWGHVATLEPPPSLAENDLLGQLSVALAGDIAFVPSRHAFANLGAIYVYRRDEGGADNWGYYATITDPLPGGGFGGFIDAQGDLLAASGFLFQREGPASRKWKPIAIYGDSGSAPRLSDAGLLASHKNNDVSLFLLPAYPANLQFWKDGFPKGGVAIDGTTALIRTTSSIYVIEGFDCNDNGVPDDCDIATGFSTDCNDNGIPDECDIDSGFSPDCNDNGIPDECEPDCNANGVADACDIDSGSSEDCNENGVPDECEPDCNDNGIADACDIASEFSRDDDSNGIPDECQDDCNDNGILDSVEIASGSSQDCNANGVPDECDIAFGFSQDCLGPGNGNGIPDECEQDCDDDGIPDSCEIALGGALDCNENGIPDACEIESDPSLDCNANTIPDSCDIASGYSEDCDANGIPDECQPDCNENNFPDACDIALGVEDDCNHNGIPDSCDIAAGTSADLYGNGVPDECECVGDFNHDGATDVLDFSILAARFSTNVTPHDNGDIDGNGFVDVFDFTIFASNFGCHLGE